MPKGINIENTEVLNRFILQIQQKIDFTVTVQKNYQLFADYIYAQTNCSISTSTIKRLFSKNCKTVQSKYTLDCIACAIGFTGWDDFVFKDKFNTEFEYHEIIRNLNYTDYKDPKEFYTVFYHFLNTPHKYDITLKLIESAIRKNDEEVLTKLFDLPKIWESTFVNQPAVFFFEEVSMLFRDTKIPSKLIKIYAKHPVAQSSLIEIAVDEERLDGQYGALLCEYAKHKTTTEAQLFYHCLMCQRDFEKGDYTSEHFDYLIHFRTDEKIHPIPLTRRLALLTIKYNDDSELVETFLEELHSMVASLVDENITYFMIYKFCSLIFYTKDVKSLQKALSFLPEITNDVSYYYYYKRFKNMLRIYESLALVLQGETAKAQQKLQNFNHLYCAPSERVKINTHFNYVKSLIEETSKK